MPTIRFHEIEDVNAALLLFWEVHELHLPDALSHHLLLRKECQQLFVRFQVPVDVELLHPIDSCIQKLHVAAPVHGIPLDVKSDGLVISLFVTGFFRSFIEIFALMNDQPLFLLCVILVARVEESNGCCCVHIVSARTMQTIKLTSMGVAKCPLR